MVREQCTFSTECYDDPACSLGFEGGSGIFWSTVSSEQLCFGAPGLSGRSLLFALDRARDTAAGLALLWDRPFSPSSVILHEVKGLGFRIVAVTTCDDSVIPSCDCKSEVCEKQSCVEATKQNGTCLT